MKKLMNAFAMGVLVCPPLERAYCQIDIYEDDRGGSGGAGGGSDLSVAAAVELSSTQSVSSNTKAACDQEEADYALYGATFGSVVNTSDARQNGMRSSTTNSVTAQFSGVTFDSTSVATLATSIKDQWARLGQALQVLFHDLTVVTANLEAGDITRAKSGLTRVFAGLRDGVLIGALTGGFTANAPDAVPNP